MRKSVFSKLLMSMALIFISLTYMGIPARAADGELDVSFDTDGIVTTNIGGNRDFGSSVAIQADGKILFAGSSNASGTSDFVLVRYNINGSLDTSFDTDGIASTDIGAEEALNSVVIQPDGKILVTGYTGAGSIYDLALLRYNINGSLDTSFDTDGIVTTDISTDDDGRSVAVQPDGKILVAGYSNASSNFDFVLLRYNANGSLDTSFDTDGIATTNIGAGDFGYSLVVLPDGKILVAGYSNAGGTYDFALLRYNANGSLDTSFDTDGIVTTNVSDYDDGRSVAIQPDGKILVAGYSNAGVIYDFALLRYNANGSLDTSFDTDGIAITNVSSDEGAYSLAVQPDGKILVAGNINSGGDYDFSLIRYDSTLLGATLTVSTATSSSASITFMVTANGAIDCSTLSTTAGVDFTIAGITAITSITQTSPTECTISATSSALADGVAVTSTLTAASSFSVGFTNGNSRTTISGSPQSVTVTVPATMAPNTIVPVAPSLPATGSNSSTVAILALVLLIAGFVLANRRRIAK